MRQYVYRMYSDDVSIYAVREKKARTIIDRKMGYAINIDCVCECMCRLIECAV